MTKPVITIPKIHAERALSDYTRRHARTIIIATLGDGAGHVNITGRVGWVWIRLRGDSNQLTQAFLSTGVPLVEGILVEVEYVKPTGYVVRGLASAIIYASNPWAGSVPSHASQHLRGDFASGGFDPLDVYTRMMISLRARPQTTPGMSVWVECGFYSLSGTIRLFEGGSSSTITAPVNAGEHRCDLLYMGSDDILHFVVGTPTITVGGPGIFSPPRPSAPSAECIPIAFIYTTVGQTQITEAYIEDARVLWTAAGLTGALPLTTRGDLLTRDATTNVRLALSAPAANVRNVLGVDNGELDPSWKAALDATGPADVSSAASAGTSVVFPHRDHAHRGVASIKKSSASALYGAVTLSEGANVTLTQAGQDIAIAATGGSALHVDTTPVGNVGVGEDNLITYSVPGGTLSTNGDYLHFVMSGIFAASINNKRVRIYFGAQLLLDTGALAITAAGSWMADGYIIRTGAATQRASVRFASDETVFTSDAVYSDPTETLSGAVTLKATGEATSDNDVVQKFLAVEKNGGGGGGGSGTDLMKTIFDALTPNTDPIDMLITSVSGYIIFVYLASHNANSWKTPTNATYTVPVGKVLIPLFIMPTGVIVGDSTANRAARLRNTTDGTDIIVSAGMQQGWFPWVGDGASTTAFATAVAGKTVDLEIWNKDATKRAAGAVVVCRLDNA